MPKSSHIGSSFDDFLREEGIYNHCTSVACLRVLTRIAKEAALMCAGVGLMAVIAAVMLPFMLLVPDDRGVNP